MVTKSIFKAGILAAAVLATGSANALQTYSVSNAATNCGSSPHGLWTNTYNSAGCNEYYSFDPGSTLSIDGNKARLVADATNSQGDTAKINILFGGFQDTYSPAKEGGGSVAADWDFFTYIISGTIKLDGLTFNPLLVGQPSAGVASSSPKKPVLQVGTGANDKSGVFGASAWLDIYGDTNYTGGAHWDLNMDLTVSDRDVPVPLPATLALFGLGLAGLGFSKRKKA